MLALSPRLNYKPLETKEIKLDGCLAVGLTWRRHRLIPGMQKIEKGDNSDT